MGLSLAYGDGRGVAKKKPLSHNVSILAQSLPCGGRVEEGGLFAGLGVSERCLSLVALSAAIHAMLAMLTIFVPCTLESTLARTHTHGPR